MRAGIANAVQAIIADWGDDLEITVTSNLQTNGTGMHWHGMRQLGSNQEDGVNGITECPIVPGQSRTYRFKATQYGTSVSSYCDGNSCNITHSSSGIIRTTLYSMPMGLSAP